MKEDILKKSESILKSEKIFLSDMSFKREKKVKESYCHSVSRSVEELEEERYKVSLTWKIEADDESLKLQVTVSGIFNTQDVSEDVQEVILNKNTVAILFPFLRSQITLLTAQPDLNPIVLPAININALLESME